MPRVPVVLSIAGSDPSGGAGIQADLKVFADHGVYGAAAIAALTVQDTMGVHAVHAVDPGIVRAQVTAVLADLRPAAVKTGMLATGPVAAAVADALDGWTGPLVVDPVLASSSGTNLLDEEGRRVLMERLLRRASVFLPNLPEAATLLGDEEPAAWARRGGVALLLKDGHGAGREVVDRLFLPDGHTQAWRHPRQKSRNLHGTGCTLSAALAARLARGEALAAAAEAAIGYVARLIANSSDHGIGKGRGPLLHGS